MFLFVFIVMPNSFKSGTTATNGCIYDGNFIIGVDPAFAYGPTSTTSFYNGITPPTGGYTIYQNKAANGPSIRTAADDATMVSILQSMGSTETTAAGALNWVRQQSDIMVANIDYYGIVTSGLTFAVDAGYVPSYPLSGTAWYDLSGNVNDGTLVNSPTFSTGNGGSITFDGTNDYVSTPLTNVNNVNFTYSVWFKTSTTQKSGVIGIRRQACFTTCDVCTWYQAQLYITGDANAGTAGNYLVWNQFNYCNGGFQGDRSYFYNTQSVTDGNWKNVVITSNSTSTVIYLNNSVISTLSGTATAPKEAATFTIGAASNYPSGILDGYYFTGNIAQTLFYNRSLSSAEVSQNYNALKSRFGL